MSPDVLLGFDKAKGESKTVICVWDELGHQVASTTNTTIKLGDAIKKLKTKTKEYGVEGLHVEWKATMNLTHKQARRLKKFRKEFAGHKPRIPRKMKKRLKTVLRMIDLICNEYE